MFFERSLLVKKISPKKYFPFVNRFNIALSSVMKGLFIFILAVPAILLLAQTPYSTAAIPEKPFSYLPYHDFPGCQDTVRVLWFKKEIDMGLGMPEWNPVRNHNDNVVFEGTVIRTPNSVAVNTHVSQEDMPLYHYTHDFSFNVIPDEYPDHRYRNLLCNIVEARPSAVEGTTDVSGTAEVSGSPACDTTEQEYLHVEWETGLGANARNNPCSEANRQGKSCGFFSAGHERGDTIWNWPTIGDWVHLEGLWIWDRGHPPADAEIHPLRFVATRRQLPEKIPHPQKPGAYVWATRVDIFASGDGGALYNNRADKPPFAHPVRMGEKDYSFNVKPVIPAPSPEAPLRYQEVKRKGNTFDYPVALTAAKNAAGESVMEVRVPWKGREDTLVLAETVYLYWDEGSGKPADYEISTYRVTLLEMTFLHRKEFFSRHEMRAFAEVGGNWFFLNELYGKNDILDAGMGKTYRRRWQINLSFTVSVPQDAVFRVHANSWECDGINERMGTLMDPYSPCTHENKRKMRKALSVVSPLRFKGCMNDLMGEVHDFHTPETLTLPFETTSRSFGFDYEDICLCNKDTQNDMMSLRYRIVRAGVE